MFYETAKNNHGLPYNPYKSIVVPRPIGWITTQDLEGRINLAPYSQFNNLGYDPPYVMFSSSSRPGGSGPRIPQAMPCRAANSSATWRRGTARSDQHHRPDGIVRRRRGETGGSRNGAVQPSRAAACQGVTGPSGMPLSHHADATGHSVDNIVYLTVVRC